MFTIKDVGVEKYKSLLIKNGNIHIPLTQAPGYSESNIYLLLKESNNEVGLISISLRKKFRGLIKYARINNGPVIFSKIIKTEELLNLIFIFLRKKGYRFIFFAPYHSINYEDIKKLKFIFNLPLKSRGTIIINLNKKIDEISRALKQKWRNTLNKGLKNVKVIKLENHENKIKNLSVYREFAKNKKNFIPIDTNICLKWLSNKDELIKIDIYTAVTIDQEFLGSVGIASFAKASCYLFGFSNNKGRKLHANSVLLWYAIKEAKSRNHDFFDLGELDESTPPGIKRFKEGLGGNKIINAGEFLKIT